VATTWDSFHCAPWSDAHEPVTDAGLQELTGFKNLQTLNVQFTKVTEGGVKKPCKALPGVNVMR
jgi:hypothetical protein